ncbi:MAG: ribulose-phosphate 3-epimerase [Candidatus Omnitrophota bacterium]
MKTEIEILPSLLSADFSILTEEIKKVEQAGCKKLHLDVMDGHFVPNITIGPVVIKKIRKKTKLFLDAHLMIENPQKYINDFKEAGSDGITIHQEACEDFLGAIRQIKSLGLVAGVALRPKTSVDTIKNIIHEVDLILIMSVEPGFGGQAYIDGSEKKIEELARLIKAKGLNTPIQVDGGINILTAPLVAKAGATQLVAGNAVFCGDVIKNINALYKSIGKKNEK